MNGLTSCSSSSTVMAYAADNLFIGSLSTNGIYTVASDLANVGDDQTLALGVIPLSFQFAEELTYRDMIIVSESLQMLPGKHIYLRGNQKHTVMLNCDCVGTLQPTDRQRDLLAPVVANSPPRLSDLSSSLQTIIEWDESSLLSIIQNTPVHYVLQYTLSSLNEVQNVTVSLL